MFDEVVHQVQISGPQMDQTYLLPPGKTTIGRQAGSDLVFVHPLVSRHHAELTCTADTCQITDLGSTHGTLLNHVPLEANQPVTLNPGDLVEIGAFRLEYEKVGVGLAETPEEAPTAVEVEEGSKEEAVEKETAVPPPTSASPPPAAPAPVLSAPPRPVQDWPTAEYVPLAPVGDGSGRNGRGPGAAEPVEEPFFFTLPPGLSLTHSRYLEYLPDIYRAGGEKSFMVRFLALLESILAPLEWTVDNFDLFLDPKTAPVGFLPWLANWYDLTFDESWDEAAQRTLLTEAYLIYRRRGTAWALRRLLEIYTGRTVEIDDQNVNLDDFTFAVRIAGSEREMSRTAVERLINANKPAHTSYTLQFIE
ncbi:MAG: phage tail protein I [Anaerolineales bacterium]|nr:phage tail protein I [Anaerolineales bacterium]